MTALERALSIEGATTHLRLGLGRDAITLRVFRDPTRTRRVYRRAGDLGITHVEPVIPPSLVEAVAALCASLEGSPGEVDAAVAPATLEVLRATFDDQRVPHWPASMRTGSGPGLWPYDAELMGVTLGVRRLIRREWLASDPARAADDRWLASNGLRTSAVPAVDGRIVVLASREASVLEEAVSLEPHVERPSPEWERAASRMGELLGYPPCCVRTFVAARARDDASLFAERLPPPRHEPLPPEVLWLNAALALVSHSPCTPRCTPTLMMASAVRAALGASSAWAELAGRLHAITRSGRVLAIAASGTLASGLDVVDAAEIAPTGAVPDVRRAPLAGRIELDGLVLHGLDEPCTLFSDHRGVRSDETSFRSAASMAGEGAGPSSTR